MAQDIKSIMSLEVPFVVVLGEQSLILSEIKNWIPGSIIELGKEAEEDLEIGINNKQIGEGSAVKIGENFGIQVNYIGDPKDRINAMGGDDAANAGSAEDMNAEDLAAALLDGQL